MSFEDVRALLFDVFGTCVDWRGTVIREGNALNRAKGLSVDWGAFADEWRGQYAPNMQRVMRGELPWTRLDGLHRMALDELLAKYGVQGLSEAEKDQLNRVWHRLDPWTDTVPGLLKLKHSYLIAPLSNGNLSLLTNMAKHAGLPWDCVLSAELFRAYKPDPRVYLGAVDLLDLQPHQVMMVAAHKHDLHAARAQGLQAAFVPRPFEGNPERVPDLTPDPEFEVVAADFMDLARQLGG
ncbi:MAG TPA: haloacid dehalogenase type II [Dehalococcoidia bacterium]|nr:haloacid dehalogenase type II [Dehalococcoidia bacterium]